VTTVLFSGDMYLSYGQLIAYDADVSLPGLLWDDDHVRQGFARRVDGACIGTLSEHGHVHLRVVDGRPQSWVGYERVVSLSMSIRSGVIRLHGIEAREMPATVRVQPGMYRLAIAQSGRPEEEENSRVDVYLWATDGDAPSEILVADEELMAPPVPLREDATVA
jgi:hypothetical protein